jgi:hypothetical protein
MMLKRMRVVVGIALLFDGVAVSAALAQQPAAPPKVVHLMGLTGVKRGAKGNLLVEKGNLHFARAKTSSDVTIASLQDIVTGADSVKAVGNTIGLLSMAAPYESGRFLSLFRRKIDTLTVQYQDADGGAHGAVFTMPVGTADVIKKDLVAQGAHTLPVAEPNVVPVSTYALREKENNVPASPEEKSAKITASAIQVEMIHSDEIKLPAAFQMALYENLVRQLEKEGKFKHVYRDGDRNASSAADVVVLHGLVRGFKAGSERLRQVTTVAGATSITVHCQFTNADGRPLLARDVNGKVRFFGGNLRATYDFAKRASRVARENFSAGDAK